MTQLAWGTTSLVEHLKDSSGGELAHLWESVPFQQTIYLKNTAPPSLPTVASSTSTSSHFADLATSTPSGGFQTASSTGLSMNFQGHGLEFVPDGEVSDSNYKIGLGTHYEEFLGYFQVPPIAEVILLGNDSQTNSRGTLQIANISGTWRFQWKQFEALGPSAMATYTFSTISVPVTATGVGVSPTPFYLRFLREVPTATGSGDTGQLNLIINDGTTEQSETIIPTGRLDTSASTMVPRFGGTTAGVGNIPKVTVFWHRATSSDSAATVGTLTTTRWSTPTVYSSTTLSSDSGTPASYLDSGDNANYWQAFGTPGSPIVMQGGSRLKFRVAATNTLGSETFSGASTTMQNLIVEDIGDLQGRYLAVEFLFEVGSDYPMQMGGPYLSGEGYGTSTYDTTQHLTSPSVVSVGLEPTSVGSLPSPPDFATKVVLTARTKLSRMESAHSVSYPNGTKMRRKYTVSWMLDATDKAALETFLLSCDGGEQAFTWTAPGDSTTSKASLASDLEIVRLAPDAFRIAADLEEVF